LIIEVVKLFKYLGITVESDKGFRGAIEAMQSAATKTIWSVLRQAQERDIRQISLKVMLFKTMVLPVMSYEIWSLSFLRAHEPFAMLTRSRSSKTYFLGRLVVHG
jgi:hypothetical protein